MCQYVPFFENNNNKKQKTKKKKKKNNNNFSKYINIKIEMSLCNGKRPNWKLYSPLRETVALMPSYTNLNFLTSFKA